MRIRKRAKQKNFTVDTSKYSLIELLDLLQTDKIYLTNRIASYEASGDKVNYIYITLDKGKYTNMVKLKDGSSIFVKL